MMVFVRQKKESAFGVITLPSIDTTLYKRVV